MNFQIITLAQKNWLLKHLNEQFGIKEIPFTLIKTGEEKISAFSGNLKLLDDLKKCGIKIISVGNCVARQQNQQIVLNIEGTNKLKNQITKNVFELNREQAEKWMHGNQLEIKTDKTGFVVMKYQDNFLGVGKASENKIGNPMPKNRRLKEKHRR